MAIRKGNDDLIYGDYTDIAPEHREIFAYTRTGKNNEYLVVLNMSDKKADFNIDPKFKQYQLVIANQTVANKTVGSNKIQLDPWEAILYKRK